ncbi:MAG: hypothetical protein ACJASM_002701 [Salibacteraceae bacterium]|jgi:hypothetical protein
MTLCDPENLNFTSVLGLVAQIIRVKLKFNWCTVSTTKTLSASLIRLVITEFTSEIPTLIKLISSTAPASNTAYFSCLLISLSLFFK